MNSNELTRFVIFASLAFSTPSLNAQTGPLGFTVKQFNQGHAGSVCDRAAWLRSLTSKPQVFVVNDEEFNKNTGTTFVGGLRDPDFVIIGKYWRRSGQCPPEDPCCTIDIGLDEYVVNTKSKRIVHSPTVEFRSVEGGKAYFYSALRPLYRPNTSLLTGFLLWTLKNPGDQAPEIWVVDVDGTPRGQLFKGQVLGNHGCVLSPNQKYLACEQLGEDWLQKGFLLAKFDGKTVVETPPPVNVKWNDKLIPFGAVIWSSDSDGFVFYACTGYRTNANVYANRYACASGGWLIYYDVKAHYDRKVEIYTPLAETWMPSFFCSRYDVDPQTEPQYPKLCRHYGGPNLGSDIAVASRVPGVFYYSALKVSKDGSKPRRVIGKVATSHPKDFKPLPLTQLLESGHPALSPDGKVIAFSAASERDKRALLYTINICTGKIQSVPIESLATDEEVYNPVWQDPLKVSTLDCGPTTQ